MAAVYEHVTPETKQRILAALEARWEASVLALRAHERARLSEAMPQMTQKINEQTARRGVESAQGSKIIAPISPHQP